MTAIERHQQGGALAAPGNSWAIRGGAEDGDLTIPRLIIHQGDISIKEHGEYPKGTLLDSLMKIPLPSKIFSLCAPPYKTWIKYRGKTFGGGVEYVKRNIADVPEADRVWNESTNEPPAATVFWNFPAVVEGMALPISISIRPSSRAERQVRKALYATELARRQGGAGPGRYEIALTLSENAKGRWYIFGFKFLGNADGTLLNLSRKWEAVMAGTKFHVDDESQEPAAMREPGEDDPEDCR